MKLSRLIQSAGELKLTNDPDLIIELDGDDCLRFTGVLRVSDYTDAHGNRHLCLLPASALVRHDTHVPGGKGVTLTPREKAILWKNIK